MTPLLFFAVFESRLVFAAVFGSRWAESGAFAAFLAFAGYMYFLTSWLDRLFDVNSRQRLALGLEVARELGVVGRPDSDTSNLGKRPAGGCRLYSHRSDLQRDLALLCLSCCGIQERETCANLCWILLQRDCPWLQSLNCSYFHPWVERVGCVSAIAFSQWRRSSTSATFAEILPTLPPPSAFANSGQIRKHHFTEVIPWSSTRTWLTS